jgi:hypothetical protein
MLEARGELAEAGRATWRAVSPVQWMAAYLGYTDPVKRSLRLV